jgi:hypothetical protein
MLDDVATNQTLSFLAGWRRHTCMHARYVVRVVIRSESDICVPTCVRTCYLDTHTHMAQSKCVIVETYVTGQ